MNLDQVTYGFRFPHGLGDCVHFAHVITAYREYGWAISVRRDRGRPGLWELLGVDLTDKYTITHPWLHSPSWSSESASILDSNKVAFNAGRAPLPSLAVGRRALWERVIAQKIRVEETIPAWAWLETSEFLEGVRGPMVAIHLNGHSSRSSKDISIKTALRLQSQLVEAGFFVILLDEDGITARLDSERVRSIRDRWSPMPIECLCALISQVGLIVGIDSGPLHLCSATSARSIGIWTDHKPHKFSLPSEKANHLVRDELYKSIHKEHRVAWNMDSYGSDDDLVVKVLSLAGEYLADSRAKERHQFVLGDEVHDGFYRYSRIGYDGRTLQLLADGRVGVGAGGCESRWKVHRSGASLILRLYDKSGSVTAAMVKETPDAEWHGRWLVHEKMPVCVSPGRFDEPIHSPFSPECIQQIRGMFEGNSSMLAVCDEIEESTVAWALQLSESSCISLMAAGERKGRGPFVLLCGNGLTRDGAAFVRRVGRESVRRLFGTCPVTPCR